MDGPGGTGTGTGTSSAPGSGWIWDQVQVEGPADMDQAIHLQPPIAGGDDSLSSSVAPDPASSFLPRTMSNADFDALLHNYTAAGAGAPPSSMMTFDQNVDPQANNNKSDPIATAAADASTAAAVAALQANGLINPLRPNSSGASGSVHGFDWSQDPNNHDHNAGFGGDLSMAAPSMRFSNSNNSFASSCLAYDAGRSIGGGYQQGRASWDGASASRTALNQQLAAAARGESLTPGQESSDSGGNTSTASTKRRRMTFSGVDSSHQAGRGRPPGHGAAMYHQQPESSAINDGDDDGMRSLSNAWGRAAPAAPLPPFSTSAGGNNHVVNSRDLEAMAAETLQRASAENSRSIDGAGNLSAMPASIAPGLAHHQQHHQQQRQRQQPRSQAAKGSGPIYAGDSSAGQSSSAPTYVSSQQVGIGNNTNSHAAASANAHAHAQAHPSSSLAPTTTTTTLLRAGQDGSPSASSGAQAAHEFTRRKGWAHRVVDELLDFSFVLSPDQEARIVHATNSVHGITGWKADSLKGESLFSFIHPQDAPALQRQLARSLETGEDMLLYYRFRRNPATIAARAKVRLAKENGAAGGAAGAGAGAGGQRQARSPSAAMSSSADSSTTPSDEYGAGARSGKPHPASVGEVDPDADWVTFEMSGHVYHVPVDVDPSRDEVAGAREEEDEGSTSNSNSNSNDSSLTTKSRSTGSATANANAKLEEASNDGSAIYKPASTSSGPVATTSSSSPPRPKKYPLPLARRSEAQCFFCSCRVYPSKGVTVLDSFLELKLENEKLRRQLEDLNIAEAQGAAAGQDSGEGEAGSKGPFAQAQDRRSSNTPTGSSSASRPGPSVLQGKSKSSGSGGAASKVQSADSVTAVSGSHDRVPTTSEGSATGRDSLSEAGQIVRRKHSTTAAAAAGGGSARRKSHETGSAQSHSLGTPSNSTGGATTAMGTGAMSSSGASPSLPASTSTGGSSAAGAALEEDRVCTDCGRTDSPEWRKGPLGPKTLCNACGLRYAKRVKKKAQAHAQVQGAVHGNLVGGGQVQHGLPLGETMGVGVAGGEEMGMDGLTAGAGGGGGGAPPRMTTPRVPSNGAVLAHSPTPARRASGHAGMIYAGSAGGVGSEFGSPNSMAAQLSQQSPGSSYVNHQQHQHAHAHAHAHAHGQHGLPHQHQQSPYGPFAHPATATTAARYMNSHPYQHQPQPQQQQYAGMDTDLTGAFTSYDPSTGVSFPAGPGGGAGEHQQQQVQGGGLTDGGFGYNLQTQHQPGWGEGR